MIHYNEEVSKINKIYKEVLDTTEDTYNFEVEDCHTYYVTDSDVLVHNTCVANVEDTISTNDVTNNADKVHGNSLKSTKTNYGYELVDKTIGETMKFGESIYGTKRYSNSFYNKTNTQMRILTQGSKLEIHIWQHQQIVNYYNEFEHLPPMNKSFW